MRQKHQAKCCQFLQKYSSSQTISTCKSKSDCYSKKHLFMEATRVSVNMSCWFSRWRWLFQSATIGRSVDCVPGRLERGQQDVHCFCSLCVQTRNKRWLRLSRSNWDGNSGASIKKCSTLFFLIWLWMGMECQCTSESTCPNYWCSSQNDQSQPFWVSFLSLHEHHLAFPVTSH